MHAAVQPWDGTVTFTLWWCPSLLCHVLPRLLYHSHRTCTPDPNPRSSTPPPTPPHQRPPSLPPTSQPGFMLSLAGVPKGAILTQVNHRPVPTLASLAAELAAMRPGQQIPVQYFTSMNRHRMKSALLRTSDEFYGPLVLWERSDAEGRWHPVEGWDGTKEGAANGVAEVTKSPGKGRGSGKKAGRRGRGAADGHGEVRGWGGRGTGGGSSSSGGEDVRGLDLSHVGWVALGRTEHSLPCCSQS